MTSLDDAVKGLLKSWDDEKARKAIWDMTIAAWQGSGPDEGMQALAVELRRALQGRLAAAQAPREQFVLLDLLHGLEQGMGNREAALDLARRAVALAGDAPEPIDRVRAAFHLAKAWYYVDNCAETIRWSREGLCLGGELESQGGGGAALKRLLADQQACFTVRITTVGGLEDEVDQTMAETIARWEELQDPAGLANALGLLTEARMIQGRWADAVGLARRSLQVANYPQETEGTAFVLWCGGRSLARLGDTSTALDWTELSIRLCQEQGNASGAIEARFSHASTLCLAGRGREALREIDEVVRDVAALRMEVMIHWVVLERAWIRMKLGVPTPPEELSEGCRAYQRMGHRVMEAEMLYALSLALDRAGRDGRKELEQSCALFERFRMTWHLEKARRGELLF